MSDYSLFEGQLRDPFTPTEKRLWDYISENRNEIITLIYNNLTVEWSEILPYRVEGINRAYRSYIEKHFPLISSDVQYFVDYATKYIAELIQKDRNNDYMYKLNLQCRTKDPTGFKAMNTPEVVDNDNKLIEFSRWR